MTQHQAFRVGILGGMGPLAGIELHRLILDATPAAKDQDHLQVVLFTNPKIPDRTESLEADDGHVFATAAGESVAILEKAGVDVIVMACMTAHSRIQHIQAHTSVPILSGITLVHNALRMHYRQRKVALLATSGSIRSSIYTSNTTDINLLIPKSTVQKLVTDGIYKIKAGSLETGSHTIRKAMQQLQDEGAEAFILGCTELGLLYADLQERGYEVLEPMRLLANQIVLLESLTRTKSQVAIPIDEINV